MRKLLLLGVGFSTLAIGPALAADMRPAPAYAPPPPPVFSWTGFYVGGNVGYSWGRSENKISVIGLPPFVLGLSTASLARGDMDETDVDGVIGGVQAGFNWQAGNWVIGTESDFQGSAQEGDTRYCGIGGTTCDIASLDASHKLSWFGTTRSRLGYLATPNVLLYGTAGVA